MSIISPSPALPISAIPVERFVERLYAPLAWEATVRLGDPAIASRLVERVLHRAWEERERFATFDALYRHVQDAAMAAVTAEAERRRDVTRFDGDSRDLPVPGSLEHMSLDAVRRRIGEGRKPAATPPEAAAPVITAPPAPTPPSAPEPVSPARPAVVTSIVREDRAIAMPELSPNARRSGAVHGAFPGAVPRASRATARPAEQGNARPAARRTPRPSGSIARFAAVEEPRFTLDEQQKRLAIAAGVVLAVVGALTVVLGGSPDDPQQRALAALADTTGRSFGTERAALQDVTLPDSSIARLGASASVRTNATFGDGARALHVAGPVSVSLRQDSTALAAIVVGEHRFLTAGTVAAFASDAAGRTLVQVDSGDLVLWRDSSRVRLTEGSVVRLGEGTPMPLTRDERNAAFGWRQGRLQLAGQSLKEIASAARQWYGVDLRYPAERSQTDTASLDVPLASRDSLADALASALRARAEVTGDRIVLRNAAASAPPQRGAPGAGSTAGATAGATARSTGRPPALEVPVLTAPVLLDPKIPPSVR